MLKQIQLDSIHFHIAKQTITHSCNSALNYQFPILSKLLHQKWRDQSVETVIYVCGILIWYKPPLFFFFWFTRRSCCSSFTTYLKDSGNNNYIIQAQYKWRCVIVLWYYKLSRTDCIQFRVSKLIRMEQFRIIIWTYKTNSKFIIIRVFYIAR
jgi:hypothetical protein